ncbi:hypothetical protein RKE29_02860 [Streptomyces sp. B1866]|uniref:hypothetical protein n=1 Tax=Streptomyces sp. B1866 TaxID=3075431 RepID=UPI002891D4E0|nr:hypothetical protein [Streptomyces sp. B1866]MDT3395600.1 hypothetical protein [Streptomyces sp. B1866]
MPALPQDILDRIRRLERQVRALTGRAHTRTAPAAAAPAPAPAESTPVPAPPADSTETTTDTSPHTADETSPGPA